MKLQKVKHLFFKLVFHGSDGSMREKFYITAKTLPRLQYLHEGWFGKKIEKLFDSADAVGNYFVALFNSDAAKKVYQNVEVQGEENVDGKVYTKFGYSGFILDKDATLGVFERGSSDWMTKVKKQASPVSNDVNLGIPDSTQSAIDSLPF